MRHIWPTTQRLEYSMIQAYNESSRALSLVNPWYCVELDALFDNRMTAGHGVGDIDNRYHHDSH